MYSICLFRLVSTAPDNWAIAMTRILWLAVAAVVLSGCLACAAYSVSSRKTWPMVIGVIGSLLLATGIGAKALKDAFDTIPETANVAFYRSKLAERQPTGLVSHFPPAVPASATSVRFSAAGSFGMGSGWIQLRLQLPPAEVAAIEANARSRAGRIYPGGGDQGDHLTEKNGWPTARWHTGNSLNFPKSYTFYVFNASDYSGGSWDQYDNYGIAVSPATNEVVYWATR